MVRCAQTPTHAMDEMDVWYIDIVPIAPSDPGIDGFYRELGNRVRSHRGKRLTQLELATAVGLSRAAIANIELGRQRVPLHMLLRFADALDVTPHELLPSSLTTRSEAGTPREIRRLRALIEKRCYV